MSTSHAKASITMNFLYKVRLFVHTLEERTVFFDHSCKAYRHPPAAGKSAVASPAPSRKHTAVGTALRAPASWQFFRISSCAPLQPVSRISKTRIATGEVRNCQTFKNQD